MNDEARPVTPQQIRDNFPSNTKHNLQVAADLVNTLLTHSLSISRFARGLSVPVSFINPVWDIYHAEVVRLFCEAGWTVRQDSRDPTKYEFSLPKESTDGKDNQVE